MTAVKNPQLRAIIISCSTFYKRSLRTASDYDHKSQHARRRAIKLRRKGENDGSRMQMKTHLQMQAWKNNIENFALKLEDLCQNFEVAHTMTEVSKILEKLDRFITSSFTGNPDMRADFREEFFRYGLFP